jgi:hypothetical protein
VEWGSPLPLWAETPIPTKPSEPPHAFNGIHLAAKGTWAEARKADFARPENPVFALWALCVLYGKIPHFKVVQGYSSLLREQEFGVLMSLEGPFGKECPTTKRLTRCSIGALKIEPPEVPASWYLRTVPHPSFTYRPTMALRLEITN